MSKKDEICPSVSIIIVNFNGKEVLRPCLTSLLATNYSNFEITIVDNASTDGSVELIEKLFGSYSCIKVIKNSENFGHAEGCNVGAKAAKGKYLVFLDSDTEIKAGGCINKNNERLYIPQNWLSELVKVMEGDKSIGIAQVKMVLAKDSRLLDYTCMAIDALGTWHATYGLKEDDFKHNFEILAASSGCCIVRRKVFEEVGGFDSDYFIYDDDTDFSLRTRLLGYKVILVPSAVIVHRGGVLRGINPGTVYHSAKNRVCTMLKNYELRNLWWRFLVLCFLMSMVSVGFLFLKKFDEAKATVKGLSNSITSFRKIWTKRLLVQSKRRIRDAELISKGLIRNDVRSTLQDLRLKLKHMSIEQN
ncbi:MAG: Glycosyltransferase AglI [Candidatus Bathyarchaeota archaeon BA2]|nr:MAG: Glycosyltransferase AglI [Candidatus Bathyarchaeota archaeon BA2]